MRNKIFILLSEWHSRHPLKMLCFIGILTMCSLFLAARLEQSMGWSDLLPSDDPRTVEFDRVIRNFVSSSSVILVVQGKEQDIQEFAETLVPRIRELQDEEGKSYVQRINYKREVEFMRNNGLMMIKSDYLENISDIFQASNFPMLIRNLNNSLEKEYIGKEESLSTREKEDRAVNFLDGISFFLGVLSKAVGDGRISEKLSREAVNRILVGEPYILSYDKKALIIDVVPNFTMVEMDRLVPGIGAIQKAVDITLTRFPGITAGLTGMPVIQHDEMIYTTKSLGYTSIIAIIAIFILLAFAFRMTVAPALAIANLVVGVIWAMGAAFLVVGNLNIMTSMTGVVLLGLGIDFSIHLISAFTEERCLGISIERSLLNSFTKCGNGIITGGFTTSAAFLTLSISSTRGMREMGIVMGCGLISVMIVTFLFLPSLLVLREKWLERKGQKQVSTITKSRDISLRPLGNFSSYLNLYPKRILVLVTLITTLLAYVGVKITFDQNYMNLEPKGLTSVALYDTILDKFDFSIDYSMFLADSLEESSFLAEKAKFLPSVAMVEDISLYIPSPEEQQKRINYVQEIIMEMKRSPPYGLREPKDMESLVQELNRLKMNIMEMQDLAYLGGQDRVDAKCSEIVGYPDDPQEKNLFSSFFTDLESDEAKGFQGLLDFERQFSPYFRDSVLKMGSGGTIGMTELPESILNRYSNIKRDRFLVTVYPIGDIWKDARFLNRFVDDLERVSHKATGMPPIFRALMKIMGKDGRNAVILTIFVVFILLWSDFRKVRYALIAMIPLATGLVWMVGIMYLLGMKLTVINIMVLPLILGIGIDDGVYVLHRWLMEGKGSLSQVFSSTGKAILLTSLTDMLAFGSLIFSIYRGFAGFGGAMFIGVATCFVTTVLILSPILGIMSEHD